MSKIVKFEKDNSSTYSLRNRMPVEVNCVYETQTFYDGTKMLVIKTYNPNSRYGDISQTIHFTKETAIQLIDILKRELNI